jgi:carboxylesterase
VLVLIHGVAESPKGMRQIAEQYHAGGYSVPTVRLNGHGSRPEDLAKFDVSDWQKESRRAICGSRRPWALEWI